MTNNWGIKVVKSGTAVTTTDPRDIYMSSSYTMFKHGIDQSGTITVEHSAIDGSSNITHGLGYTPAFLTYWGGTDSLNCNPLVVNGAAGYNYSYSNGTVVCVGRHSENPSLGEFDQPLYDLWDGKAGNNLSMKVGEDGGGVNGACRFNVLVGTTSIHYAKLTFHVDSKGTSSGNCTFVTKGIDEDNTGDFSSDPMGRTQTTAAGTQSQALVGTPFEFDIDVTNQVNEILGRGGWSDGNYMGFHLLNQSSSTGAWLQDTTFNSVLYIAVNSSISYYYRAIIFKDKIV